MIELYLSMDLIAKNKLFSVQFKNKYFLNPKAVIQ